jgi:adenylate kinase
MQKIIVITGTPGVGKTTVVRKLLKKIKGSRAYNATKLVNDYKAYTSKDKFGTKIVDIKKLNKVVLQILKKDRNKVIILDGHIFCEFGIPKATAIIIRAHLEVIKKRLLKRGYPIEKIRDNVVSEALNYCGFRARENYKNVYEIMNDKKINAKILAALKGKTKLNKKETNLLHELKIIIKKNSKFAL